MKILKLPVLRVLRALRASPCSCYATLLFSAPFESGTLAIKEQSITGCSNLRFTPVSLLTWIDFQKIQLNRTESNWLAHNCTTFFSHESENGGPTGNSRTLLRCSETPDFNVFLMRMTPDLISGDLDSSKDYNHERLFMTDVVFIGAAALFFAVSILYVRFCETL